MRDEFLNRPLLCACVGLGLGVLGGIAAPWFAVLLGWLLWMRQPRAIVLGVALAVIGFVISPEPARAGWFEDQYVKSVEMDVLTQPRNTVSGYTFQARTDHERWVVVTETRVNIARGDRIRLTGWKRSLSEASEARLKIRGINAELKASIPPEIVHRGFFVWRWALAVRQSYVDFNHKILDRRDAAIADALGMNETSEIDTTTRESFVLSGLIHYLYASGLKVFLVAAMVFAAFRRTGVSRPIRVVVVLSVLCLYVGACGLTASATRAFLLSTILLVAYMFRREYDGLSALSLGFLYEVGKDSSVIYDPGFQLTYVCLAGLSLAVPGLWATARNGGHLRSLWQVTCLGYLFALPILLLHQGAISILAPLVSFIGVVLLGPYLSVTALAWVASPVLGMGFALKPFITVYTRLAEIAALPQFVIAVPPFASWWLVGYYALLAMIWRRHVRAAHE